MKRKRMMATMFLIGFACGLALAKTALVWKAREGGAPGGELLILACVVLLIYLGYTLCQIQNEAHK